MTSKELAKRIREAFLQGEFYDEPGLMATKPRPVEIREHQSMTFDIDGKLFTVRVYEHVSSTRRKDFGLRFYAT